MIPFLFQTANERIYLSSFRLNRFSNMFFKPFKYIINLSPISKERSNLLPEINSYDAVYYPFGMLKGQAEEASVNYTNYLFTDQELDSDTGLYNYNARLYDPAIGMFITADSMVPDWTDPQTAFNTWDSERVCKKFEVGKWRCRAAKIHEHIKVGNSMCFELSQHGRTALAERPPLSPPFPPS